MGSHKPDPMSSLLFDVGGISAGAFSKQKTLKDLKATATVQQPAPVPQPQGFQPANLLQNTGYYAKPAVTPSLANTVTIQSSSPTRPLPAQSNPSARGHIDPFASVTSEIISPTSSFTGRTGSMRTSSAVQQGPYEVAQATGTFAGQPAPTAQPYYSPSASQPLAANVVSPSSTMDFAPMQAPGVTAASDDPFGLFGAAKQPAPGTAPPTGRVGDSFDLLGGFEGSLVIEHSQPAAPPPQPCALPVAQAVQVERTEPHPQVAPPPPESLVPAQRAPPAPVPAAQVASNRQKHDTVQDDTASSGSQRKPAPGGRDDVFGGALENKGRNLDVVSTEAAQNITKQAKSMFAGGTKWLLDKSKKIAKATKEGVSQLSNVVEERIGVKVPGKAGSGFSSNVDGFNVSEYHLQWAMQLGSMHEESRVAAMEAMSEEDRIIVQRVLDDHAIASAAIHSKQPSKSKTRLEDGFFNDVDDSLAEAPPANQSQEVRAQVIAAVPPPTAAIVHEPQPPAYANLLVTAAATTAATPPFRAQQQAPAPVQPPAAEVDLLGLSSGTNAFQQSPAAAPQATHEIDLFGPPASSAAASVPDYSAMFETPVAAESLMPGFDGPEISDDHKELYNDKVLADDPNEPEYRKQLRLKKIQQKHDRMKQQLAEKLAREQAEDQEKAAKVELRDSYKPKVEAWCAGKKDNIRALLSSVHTVLWEGSGWTAPNISDMVEPPRVKRVYMKANLIVHPDKVKQKGGTVEQVAIADMVFDVLKTAWAKFEAKELR